MGVLIQNYKLKKIMKIHVNKFVRMDIMLIQALKIYVKNVMKRQIVIHVVIFMDQIIVLVAKKISVY
jgi:hypothetical protein